VTFAANVVAMVVGSPVAHSLSPAMHNAEFARRAESSRYVAHEVPSGGLADFVESVRGGRIVGLSVTMPLKDEAFALVDRRDAASSRCGSSNTIAITAGELVGYNTDGDGCVNALESSGTSIVDRSCVVLGAGGTGRAVVEACGRRGAREVIVVNRSIEPAERAASCADNGRVGSLDDLERADFIVNTTPVGMSGVADDSTPVDPARVAAGCVVLDAVYTPLATPFLKALRSRGVTTIDGLWMLVHQAALQQRIWFDVVADVQVMRAAAEAELARR
jgi:shikimate dehydrogenase